MKDFVSTCLVFIEGMNSKMILLTYILLTVISDSSISGKSISQQFLKEPENVYATLGENVRLHCEVKNKTGKCQWTKDGFGLGTDPDLTGFSRYSLDISNEATCDLIIDPIQLEDEGIYQCQVGAVPGMAAITSKPVTVTVHHEPGLPHILQTKHGDLLEVIEGEEVVLECESQGGKPAADIVWKHSDGTKVAAEIVDLVTQMDDKRLLKTYSILKFVPEKDEEIICTASSDQFRAPRVSTGVKIKMKHKPKITLEFSKENLVEGDGVEVLCRVKAYPMNMRYKWFINDVEIVDENNEVLKMENIQRKNDEMNIKCRAENDIWATEEMKVLKLNLEPKIIQHPQTTFGRPDETVTLSCLAEGNPSPRYVWVKSKSNELVGVGQTLEMIVSESSEGEYACKAVSGDHQPITSESASVVMKRKPGLVIEKTKTAVSGHDILITCKAQNAFPGTKLVWSKKDQPIEPNNKYKVVESKDNINLKISSDLIIVNADTEDFTSYGCFASNELGSNYQMMDLVEETDSFLTITLVVNISAILLVLLIIGIICMRRRRTNVQFMEEQKLRNSNYLNNQDIFKNLDRSVFDKLLNRNEMVVKNDNFNINMEFEAEDADYEVRISTPKKGKYYSIPLSPDASILSRNTMVSFITDEVAEH